MKRFTGIVRRRRELHELPTMRVAIRNHCLQCCGYGAPEVVLCTAPGCWLFPFRLGSDPELAGRSPGNPNFFKTSPYHKDKTRLDSPSDEKLGVNRRKIVPPRP